MIEARGGRLWLAAALFAIALTALYLSALRVGFLYDDYVFLEQARSTPLLRWLGRLDALGNYWRPFSRQLYFEALSGVGAGSPLVFHVFNFAVFLGALALLADLLLPRLGAAGTLAGLAWFALLPLQRVSLTWVSCSQDLLALAATLGAFALWRRGRRAPATLVWLVALASKEAALPLPLVLLAWERLFAGRTWEGAIRRVAPLALAGGLWVALAIAIRAQTLSNLPLEFTPAALAAAYAHLVQTLLGVEHPGGFFTRLIQYAPPLVPLLILGAAAWLAGSAAAPESAPSRRLAALAIVWIAAFGFMVWPVAHTWSGYFYTLSAVGGAVLVALAARRFDGTRLAVLCAALLWWHAGGISARAFAASDNTWQWTSHVTHYMLVRGAELNDAMARSLREIEPAPPHGTRYFFAALPSWSGFQRGNGSLIRTIYRDSTLESYFYSQFSESTAANHPCRFLYWDGSAIRPLYAGARDPFFQVGCDLLLMDRPAAAAHAFLRGIGSGGNPQDNFYWFGWAALWSGRRADAERAWRNLHAQDDSVAQTRSYLLVRELLYARRDTLAARRRLLETILLGIGRPNPHATLGELLWAAGGEEARYGLLELKVASWLNPNDWLARRGLIVGLAETRLDDQAAAELEKLKQLDPGWSADTLLRRTAAILERRRSPVSVAMFR